MKIFKLEINGFRSFREAAWTPNQLNIIIGPNGSGKSNLLKFFDLIRSSATGDLEEYILREGGFEKILWDGQGEAIEIKIHTTPLDDKRDSQKERLDYQLQLKKVGRSGDYRIGYEILGNYRKNSDDPFKFLERTLTKAVIHDEDEKRFCPVFDDIEPNETLLSQTGTPFGKNWIITKFKRELASWRIYQLIDTSPESDIRKPRVTRRENILKGDGSNLISVLHTLYTTDREFELSINNAMTAAFGEDYEKLVFPPAADNQVQLRIRWKTLRLEQSASEISDGTLRYLYLLTILANPDPGALIAIDEPETGLHPSMMRIVAEYAEQASNKSQIIITTHSPELLTAFSDYIPSTSVIQWHNGASTIQQISEEKLRFWLQDYSLGALFSTGELEGMQ